MSEWVKSTWCFSLPLIKHSNHIRDALLTKQGTGRTDLFWDMDYGQLNMALVWKITNLSILRFFSLFYIPWYASHHLYIISDWFSNIFLQKIPHFFAACNIQTIGKGNFKGWFLRITLPGAEKLLTVLYTNCHISKFRRSMNLILVSN